MIAVRAPISVYRIQFNRDFRFVDCRDLVPYLHELGVGDVYSSPRFRPRRGSSHGYDVADPNRVNSELGTDEEFNDLCDKLHHYGMGLLLDVVPNHMAASHENPWWVDVLEHGPGSPYAKYFDIDWHPVASKAAFLQEHRVLLPVLGDLYGQALEQGNLLLQLDEGGFFVRYCERRVPLDPSSYGPILEQCVQRGSPLPGSQNAAREELEQIQTVVSQLPARTETDPDRVDRRRMLTQEIKKRIFTLYRDHLEVRLAIDAAMRDVSGTKGGPGSFDLLDRILNVQGWRLAHWKIAFEEINYRRFFDINDLVCLRVEDEEVFRARHNTIIQLVTEGKVTGLRVDHVDGLHDPAQYLVRLQDALSSAGASLPFYVVAEKVLGRGEPLPEEWRACGTTGYDFLSALNDVFIEPQALSAIQSTYEEFTGDTTPFAEICYARNKQVMWKLFAGEVHALGRHLGRLAAQDRQARDVPLSELMDALVEVTACLPVYRTYVRDFEITGRDRHYLKQTLELAHRRTPESPISSQAFQFLRSVLLLEAPAYAQDLRPEFLSFVMRWQKFTGPVMAKGLEDTAFYVHQALISRNEVGGDPLREKPPHTLEEFHAFLAARLKNWPGALNTTSTHDTKRSEDVRARINVLSELPGEWARRLRRWSALNTSKKGNVNGRSVPTASEEVLIYQTLLGAWPLDSVEGPAFIGRVKGFLIKAVREAKTYSDWLRPNKQHEAALLSFVAALLEASSGEGFLRDFLRFADRLAYHGALNSLAQVLIKITAPGVPDIYQGQELWDFSLTDPDNRRPVDFPQRIALLEELRHKDLEDRTRLLEELCARWKDGRIKLYLTDKALDFRRAHAKVFLEGGYVPVRSEGERESCVVAFARRKEGQWALTVTPRWTTRLASRRRALTALTWENTVLRLPEDAPRTWRNVLTSEIVTDSSSGTRRELQVDQLLCRFPVALLSSESA